MSVSWVYRRGGSASSMGFPVKYPISTSKHSDRRRGFEVDGGVGLRLISDNTHTHHHETHPSHPLMPTNPATHRCRSTHTITTTTTPQPTVKKKKKPSKGELGWRRGSAAGSTTWASGVGQQRGGGLAAMRGSWERERERERELIF